MGKQDPNAPVTNQALDEAVGAILKGQGGIYQKLEEHDERFDEVERRLDNLEHRLDKLETDVAYIKDEIKGLKADLSDTPSRRELEELKARVASSRAAA